MYDIGTLYPRFLDAFLSVLSVDQALDATEINKLKEAFEFSESFIGDCHWMAGDEITTADFSLFATASSIQACGFDLSEYKKVSAWLEGRENEITNYEKINQEGASILGNLVKEKIM